MSVQILGVGAMAHSGGLPEWCLYRAYDAAGDLLYIGQTCNLPARIRGHKSVQPWWDEVTLVTSVHIGSKDDAVASERRAILRESPRYNIQIARPRMVVVNFRVPASVKEAALERCQREGVNLTDALRDFLVAWAADEGV